MVYSKINLTFEIHITSVYFYAFFKFIFWNRLNATFMYTLNFFLLRSAVASSFFVLSASLCSYSDCLHIWIMHYMGLGQVFDAIYIFLFTSCLHIVCLYFMCACCKYTSSTFNILLGNSYKTYTLNTVNCLWMKKNDMNNIILVPFDLANDLDRTNQIRFAVRIWFA